MANVRQLKDHGAPIFPITHVSLVKGMEGRALMDATYAWDGTGTPDVSKIPAGVVVTYNGTDYTGTLVASASTTGRFYLVPSTTVQGEWDRYMTDGTGSSYAWKAAGNTSIPSPDVVDNETTDDSTKSHSAAGGKRLKDQLGELEAKVTDFDQEINGTDIQFVPTWQRTGYYLNLSGTPTSSSQWNISSPIVLKKGQTVSVKTQGSGACIIAETEDGTTYTPLVKAPSGISGLNTYKYTAQDEDKTIALSVKWGLGDVVMETSRPNLVSMLNNTIRSVEDIEDDTVVSDIINLTPSIIDGLRADFSSHSIIPTSGEKLYAVPIRAGQTITANWVFASGYVRWGIAKDYPSVGVPITQDDAGGTGTKTHQFTSSTDGYAVASFSDTPSSISFTYPNNGIGKNVKELEEEMSKISVYDEKIEGKGSTAVTTTIPISTGRYKLVLSDFVRGTDADNYQAMVIKVDNRYIANYYGNKLVPDTYFFDVNEGETVLTIYSRAASGTRFGVKITVSPNDGIFDYNSHDEQIDRLLNAKKVMPSGGASPFVLLHFSDIHGDATRLKRVVQYYNTFLHGIDEILHTGDMVESTVTATSFDFWDDCAAQPVLNCIGNHDVWYTGDYTPGANYPYNTYFKPYIDGGYWGTIVQPNDAEQNGLCYYYKDYTNGIRLVVLDYQNPTGMITWLESVLADAVTNSKTVIIAVHYIPRWTKGYNNPFDVSEFVPVDNTLSTVFVNAVDDFIGNGGKFVCWLTGHTHRDNTGYYQGTNGKQVVLNIDCAAMRNDSPSRYRGDNSKSQDAFNIISVNTGAKTLSVWRVGNDCDALQRHIGSMCIKYDTGELIASN